MKKYILTAQLLLAVVSLKAQHTITREKFSIVTTYDTLYVGEDYMLYVDLGKATNAEVKRNGMSVPIDANNRAQVKFKASTPSLDKNGNAMQLVHLTIKINDEAFMEDVPYVVKRLPIIKPYSLQDSVSVFLSKNEAYKKVQTADNVFIYDDFIKYLKKNLPLQTQVGQLSMAVMINSQGHVERYDFIKNSYSGITKEQFDKVILAYHVSPNMMGKFGFKFGLETFTFKGHPDLMFHGHGFIMK